jgi:hypothetical protein
MSKLNQIQTELRSINQAKFQELCDAYLYKTGLENIKSIGSAVGKEKTTKGTPDTLVRLPNGNYVFVEYTTQEKGLFGKLSDDLDDCFDEDKTGIPISKIEKVMLCHNSTLSAGEEEQLAEKCQQHGCKGLEIIGIDTLSFALYQKYPILAKDFLGVEVDTGQILSPPDFIRDYQQNAFAPRLDVEFHFREEELKSTLKALGENDLVIVTGGAGVGKTRLALESCRQFVENESSYRVFCVHNKGLPLYEDLKAYFAPDNDYLIVVDDANRVSQLDQILRLITQQDENHHIKIIVTVRDYALDKVRRSANAYSSKAEVVVHPFDNKQIRELVSTEFGILNHYYLDQICRIAKGNPRLAVMASQVVNATNKFESIADASALYEEYFSTITTDIDELGNNNLLKVAGIVAFFGFLDRTREDHFRQVVNSFGLSEDEMWEAVQRLHELEVVDLYETEVVKISDQVLATYLFYKAFIKDQLLDFSILLRDFSDTYGYKFRDAVYPVVGTFNTEFVYTRLQRHIDQRWDDVKDDEAKLLSFMELFWFLKKTDTLVYLKERIDDIEAAPYSLSTLKFEPDNGGGQSDTYLSILKVFQGSTLEDFRIALDLIFNYLEKRPETLPRVLHILLERFRFQVHSYDQGYSIQISLIDRLIARSADNVTGSLYERILLRIAGKYLNTKFRSDWMEGRRTIAWTDFRLVPCPELFQLRKSLWQFLVDTYRKSELKDYVLQITIDYSTQLYENPVEDDTNEIIKEDSKVVLPFIKTSLNPSVHAECLVTQHYLKFLERHKVKYDKSLKRKFTNELYRLSEFLLDDLYEREDLSYEEYRKHRLQLIKGYFASYRLSDYVRLFRACTEIAKHLEPDYKLQQLHASLQDVLTNLAEDKADLFKKVVRHLLQDGNQLNFDFPAVIYWLGLSYKTHRGAFNLLKRYDYRLKEKWLFTLLAQLSAEKVSRFYLDELYTLYRNADIKHIPQYFDFLESYTALDSDVEVNVVKILYERAGRSEGHFNFNMLFNPYTTTFKKLRALFSDRLDLLKAVYLYQLGVDDHADNRGEALKFIVEMDAGFITEYLSWMYDGHEDLRRRDDNARYERLWELDNYEDIISSVLNFLYEKEKSQFLLWERSHLAAFFRRMADDSRDIEQSVTSQRMERFLIDFIAQHHKDTELMSFIFSTITNSLPNKRKLFVEEFLRHNTNFEQFKKLEIEWLSWGGVGSMVPALEGKIKFLESLLPLLSTTELLKHRLYINERILSWKRHIERENKSNFIDEY